MWGHLYSLKYRVPGSYMIGYSRNKPDEKIQSYFIECVDLYNKYRHFKSPAAVNIAEPSILENLHFKLKESGFKYRTEGDYVTVYFHTKQEAKDFAKYSMFNFQQNLTAVKCPRPGTEDILKAGKQLQVSPEYKYKVMLKEGKYSYPVKQQILNYLKGLGKDQVKYSKSLTADLKDARYSYLFGSRCFYINDTNDLLFLELIKPGLVQKIIPIEELPK